LKIVGSGLLAKAFVEEDFGEDVIIFASGVSKSNENDAREFAREKSLLSKSLKEGKRLIYFSTCSIDNPSLSPTPYVTHKIKMEKHLLSNRSNTVIRLPQVVGRSRNGVTLMNFLAKKILSQEPYQIQSNAIRNIIDVDDVCSVTKYILEKDRLGVVHNCCMPGSFKVIEIVRELELVLNMKSQHTVIPSEIVIYQPSKMILQAISDGRLKFSNKYLSETILKYYSDVNLWGTDIL
jgi:nucleoside-diphosphate-sugar epimerase